ncbi:MAG: hypothetical protein JW807_07670 [Spirochaetes bacterium]|nr:hypothetical protein [Spirochaetota bacterium]
MSNFVSIIFCGNCKSRYVEISDWTSDGKAIVKCRSCNNREVISNFTLGRAKIGSAEIQNARDTMAKRGKYEK